MAEDTQKPTPEERVMAGVLDTFTHLYDRLAARALDANNPVMSGERVDRVASILTLAFIVERLRLTIERSTGDIAKALYEIRGA